MIKSMTAYARVEHKNDWGSAIWELRSVNHRYLEINLRLPEQFRNLEGSIRELCKSKISRGKIDIFLKYELLNDTQEITVNIELVNKLKDAIENIQQDLKNTQVQVVELLKYPGVLASTEINLTEINSELITVLAQAFDQLIDTRSREGSALKEFIEHRLVKITSLIAFVRTHIPQILSTQKQKLKEKLDGLNLSIDNVRLEQEMALLIQKQDVTEELDRLEAHVKEAHRILNTKGSEGKRLDFLMQEFNRESNTLASKSISSDITKTAVELKVLIEQMREQIQNIE